MQSRARAAGAAMMLLGLFAPPGVAWAEDPPECPKLQPGEYRCSGTCDGLTLSAEGQTVSALIGAKAPCPMDGKISSADEALTVHMFPNIVEDKDHTFKDKALVRLDVEVPGYEPAHPYYRVGSGDEVHTVLVPAKNIVVTLQGPGAAATVFATADGEVDRCEIDVAADEPSCSLHIPPKSDPMTMDMRVVGTANTEFQTQVYAAGVTEIRIRAPRDHFPVLGDVVVGTTLAVGLAGALACGAKGGADGGDLGFDIAGGVLTAVTLVGAYLEVVAFGQRDFTATVQYPGMRAVPQKAPGSLGALPARKGVAVHPLPNGLVVRW